MYEGKNRKGNMSDGKRRSMRYRRVREEEGGEIGGIEGRKIER